MKAQILEINQQNLEEASALLKQGELVGVPTETVYGLAGNAWDEKALFKIFQAKERPAFDPLIVHFYWKATSGSILEKLEQMGLAKTKTFAAPVRNRLESLLSAFWPGPLTVVLPKHPQIPALATSGLETVALRMPSHPVFQKLLDLTGFPLAAPSANRFGRVSPTRAEHVYSELGDRIPVILDGGSCQFGIESSVIRVDPQGEWELLRPGATPLSNLVSYLGKPCRQTQNEKMDDDSLLIKPQVSPGLLARHYAPSKPLYLLPDLISHLTPSQKGHLKNWVSNQGGNSGFGLLVMQEVQDKTLIELEKTTGAPLLKKEILSSGGGLEEAAGKLFTALRTLEESQAHVLISEPCLSREGLGPAIADRLQRASHVL